jgi:hypothetical protein
MPFRESTHGVRSLSSRGTYEAEGELMAGLTTYFYGICAHVRKQDLTGVPHRVVLVNGMMQSMINKQTIPSHIAMLHFSAADVVDTTLTLPPPDERGFIALQLGGAVLTISNDVAVEPKGLNYDTSYSVIPSLTALTPDCPPASPEVIDGRNPTLASCYFNVNHGTFYGELADGGAAVAKLVSVLDGPNAVINAGSFVWGTGTITLKGDSELFVSNLGAGVASDSDSDFLLQYRILVMIPPNAGVPPPTTVLAPTTARLHPPSTGNDVGPGCSNTNYP